MRYKSNVMDKLTQLEATSNRLQLQINRNFPQDQMLESLDLIKSQIESLREIISIEQDDFEQQFSGRV